MARGERRLESIELCDLFSVVKRRVRASRGSDGKRELVGANGPSCCLRPRNSNVPTEPGPGGAAGGCLRASSLRPSRPSSPAAPRSAASGAGRGELGSAGPSWSRRGCWDSSPSPLGWRMGAEVWGRTAVGGESTAKCGTAAANVSYLVIKHKGSKLKR